MRGRGWPKNLCALIEPFLHRWKIHARYSGRVTEDKEAECGVSQGSPLFPLVFLLYIAILFQDDLTSTRFGYADDISVIKIDNTAREAVVTVQEEINSIINRANEHKIDFDPSKSEYFLIGGGLEKKLYSSDLSVLVKEHRIIPSPVIRWLGMLLH